MGKIVRKIFFGQLRPAEFEHLMDRYALFSIREGFYFSKFRETNLLNSDTYII